MSRRKHHIRSTSHSSALGSIGDISRINGRRGLAVSSLIDKLPFITDQVPHAKNPSQKAYSPLPIPKVVAAVAQDEKIDFDPNLWHTIIDQHDKLTTIVSENLKHVTTNLHVAADVYTNTLSPLLARLDACRQILSSIFAQVTRIEDLSVELGNMEGTLANTTAWLAVPHRIEAITTEIWRRVQTCIAILNDPPRIAEPQSTTDELAESLIACNNRWISAVQTEISLRCKRHQYLSGLSTEFQNDFFKVEKAKGDAERLLQGLTEKVYLLERRRVYQQSKASWEKSKARIDMQKSTYGY